MGNILRSQSPSRPDILSHVGGNLRRFRQERGLSQSGLATLSGISRRMIVAIESGEANVSLSSLDRLAAALEVSFSQMVRPPEAPDSRRIASIAWRGLQAESQATLLGAAPATREAELWVWSLGEGERYPSEAGSGGWHEMLWVIEGVLTVETADGSRDIAAGDFLIFSSAAPYVFANGGGGAVRFIRNVVL
ncbi:MAG: helix-turn-helix transcriptional regulator [Alphaproteobacteria bacterium]|nr:helix-turn-helix transcriptional regulator [Alphaproteobacteria bacterium]MBV9370575.1 helix-turn-helix transcriptional regulator [Alphaproteobacteria bacterium]MBV9900057.1 helix-turn-helix transcriptional regulator [Alphaproteobacteria bacterium]